MRRENGAVTGIKRFDFGFSEEECIGVYGLEMMMYWIDVGKSPRMLQKEMEKGLGATLVAAVELFKLFLIILKEW